MSEEIIITNPALELNGKTLSYPWIERRPLHQRRPHPRASHYQHFYGHFYQHFYHPFVALQRVNYQGKTIVRELVTHLIQLRASQREFSWETTNCTTPSVETPRIKLTKFPYQLFTLRLYLGRIQLTYKWEIAYSSHRQTPLNWKSISEISLPTLLTCPMQSLSTTLLSRSTITPNDTINRLTSF